MNSSPHQKEAATGWVIRLYQSLDFNGDLVTTLGKTKREDGTIAYSMIHDWTFYSDYNADPVVFVY